MTMPDFAVEEEATFTDEQSVAVRVVSSGNSKSIGAEFGKWQTFYVASGTQAQQLCKRSLRRKRLLIKVTATGLITPTVTALTAIVTSGTAVQNPNGVPVNVTLTGFTATQVFVNGILVGASNGTYVVPAYGSISVTFTVVGATATAAIPLSAPQNPLDAVFLVDRDTGNNVFGTPLMPNAALPIFHNGGFLILGDSLRWECQQELWVIPAAGNSGAIAVSVCDEQYASEQPSGEGDQ